MKLYKSSFVQWLGYLALTEETGVQFPYGENVFFSKNKTLLDSIFYWYYSKDIQAKKSDNKGMRLIKTYVFKLYKLMKETLKETSSKDEQDAYIIYSNFNIKYEPLRGTIN